MDAYAMSVAPMGREGILPPRPAVRSPVPSRTQSRSTNHQAITTTGVSPAVLPANTGSRSTRGIHPPAAGTFAGAAAALVFLAEVPAGILGGLLLERYCNGRCVAARARIARWLDCWLDCYHAG